jgi:hypothetical protein
MVWKETSESATQLVGGGGGDDMGKDERDIGGTPIEPQEGVLGPVVVSMLTTIMGGEEGKISIIMETIVTLGNTNDPVAWRPA